MAMFVVPCLLSLVIIVSVVIYAHRRTRVRKRRVRADWLAWSSLVMAMILALPATMAAAAMHHWLEPHDDWEGIIGLGGGFFQCMSAPLVAVSVWLIAHLYDRHRQSKCAQVCRKCRHDLTGVMCEGDPADRLGRCPECGLLQSLRAASGRAVGAGQ